MTFDVYYGHGGTYLFGSRSYVKVTLFYRCLDLCSVLCILLLLSLYYVFIYSAEKLPVCLNKLTYLLTLTGQSSRSQEEEKCSFLPESESELGKTIWQGCRKADQNWKL